MVVAVEAPKIEVTSPMTEKRQAPGRQQGVDHTAVEPTDQQPLDDDAERGRRQAETESESLSIC